jgi:hypothetical protein
LGANPSQRQKSGIEISWGDRATKKISQRIAVNKRKN